MYFLGVWDEITATMMGAWRSLLLSLCDTIYRLIIFCFNVFEKIGTAKLLDNDTTSILYEKVGLILGIYMIFRLTFLAVQYVLDPDIMIDKQKGASKLLSKIIIVLILLGTTPYLFHMAYQIQYSIIKENIIGKIFLNTNSDTTNFGGNLSWYLFSSFYKETSTPSLSDSDRCSELIDFGEGSLIEKDFINNSSLKYAFNCINERVTYPDLENGEIETYIIDFEGLIAVVAGIGMLWIIMMYTISVGFRLVQLAFLQLIAPLPIMMYLEPKEDGPFQKWIKLCLSCYLDYFIRTAIIYFICYLISTIMDSNTSYFYTTLGNTTSNEYRYITVILIFSLLMFAKKLPELLKEIMPSSGSSFSDFGFSFKKRADNMLGGSYINKGYDKLTGSASKAAKSIGLMPLNGGKRIMTGIDSAAHGKGFWNGFTKNPGNFGTWINKQREALTPESYKASQDKREGKENVSAINEKWNSGVKIARKLMDHGFGGTTEANSWTKALDGNTRKNYDLIFKHQEYASSKFAVDKASNEEEELRHAKEALDMGQDRVTANGRTYTSADASFLVNELDKAQKKLKGLEEVHAEMAKQYQDDAKTEQEFKFIKNNINNPTNPQESHTTKKLV